MTAVACLRVAVDAEKTGLKPAVLGPLVEKFSGIYLEGKWQWPRQFAPLTHYSFLLTDPRADELDVQELARLGDDLQIKLFGEGDDDAGKVGLLLFEGSAEAVRAFAALDDAAVSAALLDPSLLPPGGRLSRIEATDSEPEGAKPASGAPEGPIWVTQQAALEDVAKKKEADQPMPPLEGVQGIYFTLRSVFVGDVVSSTPGALRTHLSLVEGDEHMPSDPQAFDADCMAVAGRILAEPGPHSMLYLPICYSNIVRASQRAAYEEMLAALPREARGQLAAAVYDVPRDPAFTALATLRGSLLKYVTSLDLRTEDPGFEVEKLPPNAVTSVTLVLPIGDQRARLAVLRRFAERLGLYRKKQIWAGVTNVRSRVELEACIAAHVPFVTGPAVCRLQAAPVGGRMQPPEALPLLAA